MQQDTCTLAQATPALGAADLRQEGPYGVVVVHDAIRVPRREGRTTKLALTVSVPAVAPAEPPLAGPPYPVVLLMNGFQARASQYAPFATRLASWGFVVMQYTGPALSIIHDSVELGFAGPVLDWLSQQTACETNPALHGRADLGRLVVAGHSRGAKLAALHFADSILRRGGGIGVGSAASPPPQPHPVHAAFLMDPVDNTRQTPEGDAYPSACKALAAAGARVGITGAGVVGATNPEGSNWRRFWASAAPGSWLGVLSRAGHTKWLQGPPAECWCLDRLFRGGSATRRVVLEATAACMIAWFSQQLKEVAEKPPRTDPLAAATATATVEHRPALVAAAVYGTKEDGEVAEGCGSDGAGSAAAGGAAALPPQLSPWLSPLIDSGDFQFTAKGGSTASHPLA